MKKIELHWRIIIGLLLGVFFGFVLSNIEGGKEWIQDWIKPFGTIFINSLKLIAIPLIFGSLIKGVSDLKDFSKLSKIGFRAFALYITTTLIAISIGLLLVNIIHPGTSISESTRNQLVKDYTVNTETLSQSAKVQQDSGPLKMFEDIVPSNIFAAASDNRNMLQVIFFSILFGIGLILVSEDKAKPVKSFFSGFNEVILRLVDILMLAAPVGVFALIATLIVESPTLDLFIALFWYALSIILGISLLLVLYVLFASIISKRKPSVFIKGMAPAQLVAFSTSSSAATLPVTMERVTEHLGVDEEVSSFVLPIGATVNMDGTSLYQAVAAVFIAQAFGMHLSLEIQLGIILTATLASIGAAAVPGAGMITLIIVLAQAGIPEAGLALIFAVDRPLDMLRTVANVTGDAFCALVVAKSIGKLANPKIQEWDDNYIRS
jgi:proton glutamate symport protein